MLVHPADASPSHVGELSAANSETPLQVKTGTVVDTSQLEPGSYSFFTTTASTCPGSAPSTVGTPVQIDPEPNLQVTSPDPKGSIDYFTSQLGYKEDLSSASQVQSLANISNASYAANGLTANNAPPSQGDPQVFLKKAAATIDPHTFHT